MLTALLHQHARSDSVIIQVELYLHPTQEASQEMIYTLRALRKKFVIGFVGGSDMVKILEQLSVGGNDGAVYHSDSR
jgi:hypothetical protein